MPLAVPLILPNGTSRETSRDAIFKAFGVADDGSDAFEIGRAETGSTCLLQTDADNAWWISIPLLRSEYLATDLFAALESVARGLDATWGGKDQPTLTQQWMAARDDEIVAALARQLSESHPPLPRLPRHDLNAAHAWMIAIACASQDDGPVARDIIAFVDVETGEAHIATLLAEDAPPSWVAPLHHIAVVRPDGVGLCSLDALDLPPDDRGLVRIDLASPQTLVHLVNGLQNLRSVSPIEVLEFETLMRLVA